MPPNQIYRPTVLSPIAYSSSSSRLLRFIDQDDGFFYYFVRVLDDDNIVGAEVEIVQRSTSS